jgi:folate-binding protein YgfZ
VKAIDAALFGLRLQGKDARSFLHRLTTVHCLALEPRMGACGLLLSATGKVEASFTVFCISGEDWLLLTTEKERDHLAEQLERLHFGEEIQFTKEEGFSVFQEATESTARDGQCFAFDLEGGALSWPLPWLPAYWGRWSKTKIIFQPADIDAFEKSRIQNKLPKIFKEWQPGQSNALDVGFQDWIHSNKGCYPGQEVIERSVSVGHPARALIFLEATCPLMIGDTLANDGGDVGTITSFLSQNALAIVPWKHRAVGTEFMIKRQGQKIGEAKCHK